MVWQQKLIECLQRFAESGGCLFHSNEDGGDGWGGRKRANACLFTLVNRSASAIYVAFSSAHICCGGKQGRISMPVFVLGKQAWYP